MVLSTHQLRNSLRRLKDLREREEAPVVWRNLTTELSACPTAQARLVGPNEESEDKALSEAAAGLSNSESALEMAQILAQLVEELPVGTNLGLLPSCGLWSAAISFKAAERSFPPCSECCPPVVVK